MNRNNTNAAEHVPVTIVGPEAKPDWRGRTCGECTRFIIRKNAKGAVTAHGCKLMAGVESAKDDPACGPDFVPREVPE